jgi:hypothetical protein
MDPTAGEHARVVHNRLGGLYPLRRNVLQVKATPLSKRYQFHDRCTFRGGPRLSTAEFGKVA